MARLEPQALHHLLGPLDKLAAIRLLPLHSPAAARRGRWFELAVELVSNWPHIQPMFAKMVGESEALEYSTQENCQVDHTPQEYMDFLLLIDNQ